MDHRINVEVMKRFLNKKFNYESFHNQQLESIEQLVLGRNVFTILPTGTGKSLIYQFFGAFKQRPVIIISPLKALMYDQVSRIVHQGFQSVAITSDLNRKEKDIIYRQLNTFQYLFLSPEMINQEEVLNHLKKIQDPLLVIDEAHCISEWGRDFRQDYLGLKALRQQLNNPQTLALTATAPPNVVKDVMRLLFSEKETVQMFRHDHLPMNRSYNILSEKEMYNISSGMTLEEVKFIALLRLLEHVEYPVLIYAGFRDICDELSDFLRSNHYVALSYHAGLTNDERWRVQELYLQNHADIVIATSAFGMGIDKKNIRTVIHFHPSASIAQFIQETGRSGRDGLSNQSICFQDKQYLNWKYRIIFDTIQKLRNQTNLLNVDQLEEPIAQAIEGLKQLNYNVHEIQKLLIGHYSNQLKQIEMMQEYINGIRNPRETFETFLTSGFWEGSYQEIKPLIETLQFNQKQPLYKPMSTNPLKRLKKLFPKNYMN
ncbi:RecQ family ATP-dependent DNA helicase [Atopobacter phocae]|uniref:RecQ family ATP-dependent DNA helicase n=1 Tax=Atopobacter phocae TaxID=136492 RepID=UPI000471B77A|nr:RecQ family ATP-dependent DNA helicase [Atopobacter phocae]